MIYLASIFVTTDQRAASREVLWMQAEVKSEHVQLWQKPSGQQQHSAEILFRLDGKTTRINIRVDKLPKCHKKT